MGEIKKGPWKAEEDEVLINHVKKYGPRDWSSIRSKGLLRRTGKSCRLRWVNKLRPDLKTGVKFSAEEERTVIDLQAQFGNKWARIATYLPGRTDNDVKNFWSSRQKRLARILQTSAPSSSKSHKNNEEVQPPAFHDFPSVEIPQLQPDFPMPLESQDFITRLGDPDFLDEFENSSGSALGTAQLPIVPSFFGPDRSCHISGRAESHDAVDIDSLIDDFPPIDIFDHFEPLPSPSEWS
ncbi:hypothetical protein Pfo_005733 [Paulownia fortunei]|nr:hypothetical protein Pfo_005733 [Paulownia fortunei]